MPFDRSTKEVTGENKETKLKSVKEKISTISATQIVLSGMGHTPSHDQKLGDRQ